MISEADRQKAITRIQSLMARAESSFEEEARTSALLAIRQMKQYGISMEDLAKAQMNTMLRKNGSRGGKARAKNLTPERLAEISQMGVKARQEKLSAKERSRIAKKAAKARWVGARLSKAT